MSKVVMWDDDMATDLEKLTEVVADSISLIEKNSHKELFSPSTVIQSLDEALDTSSLLSRCEAVCERYQTTIKPKLRIVHHLACSGGTLISKCLASMPNVYLLSEVHPFSYLAYGEGKPSYSPSDFIVLSHYARVPKQRELAAKLFKQSVDTSYQHIDKLGGILVLRDHTHSDYCTHTELPDKSTLYSLLEEDYDIESVLTIRDPIDSYISLVKNNWVHFSPKNFDEYCRRILVMLEQFHLKQIFKYEDFIQQPKQVIAKLSESLSLPFDDSFEDIFGSITLTGDSGRSTEFIEVRSRDIDCEVEKKMKSNNQYIKIADFLNIELG